MCVPSKRAPGPFLLIVCATVSACDASGVVAPQPVASAPRLVHSASYVGEEALARAILQLEAMASDPHLRTHSSFGTPPLPLDALLPKLRSLQEQNAAGEQRGATLNPTPSYDPFYSWEDWENGRCTIWGISTIPLPVNQAPNPRDVNYRTTTFVSGCQWNDRLGADQTLRMENRSGTLTFLGHYNPSQFTSTLQTEYVVRVAGEKQFASMSTRHYGIRFMRPDPEPFFSTASNDV